MATVKTSFLKGAASCVALSLFPLAVQAADVSIVPAANTVTLNCNRMVVPDKSALSVDVSRNKKKGTYLYRYTVSSTDASSPAVAGVLFKDLAEKTTTSTSPGVVTLESAAAPGVVRYSLMGAVQSGLSESDIDNLAVKFGGNRQQMQGSVDDAMSKGCAFEREKDLFERGMTGTIVGPSEAAMVKAVFTAPVVEATDREIEIQPLGPAGPLMDQLDPDSLAVTDSRLLPLQVGPAALEYRKDGTPVVRFTLETTSIACNARGVLIHARMRDGTPVTAGVDVDPPACAPALEQAQMVLPSS